jgi:hypothetical protein
VGRLERGQAHLGRLLHHTTGRRPLANRQRVITVHDRIHGQVGGGSRIHPPRTRLLGYSRRRASLIRGHSGTLAQAAARTREHDFARASQLVTPPPGTAYKERSGTAPLRHWTGHRASHGLRVGAFDIPDDFPRRRYPALGLDAAMRPCRGLGSIGSDSLRGASRGQFSAPRAAARRPLLPGHVSVATDSGEVPRRVHRYGVHVLLVRRRGCSREMATAASGRALTAPSSSSDIRAHWPRRLKPRWTRPTSTWKLRSDGSEPTIAATAGSACGLDLARVGCGLAPAAAARPRSVDPNLANRHLCSDTARQRRCRRLSASSRRIGGSRTRVEAASQRATSTSGRLAIGKRWGWGTTARPRALNAPAVLG